MDHYCWASFDQPMQCTGFLTHEAECPAGSGHQEPTTLSFVWNFFAIVIPLLAILVIVMGVRAVMSAMATAEHEKALDTVTSELTAGTGGHRKESADTGSEIR